MPCLVFSDENNEKHTYILDQSKEMQVGRDKGNEIHFSGNRKISRNHCLVYFYPEESRYVISDLGSTNGTLLNGNRISSDVILSDKDLVNIGNISFTYIENENEVAGVSKVRKVAKAVPTFGMDNLENTDVTEAVPKFNTAELKEQFSQIFEFDLKPGERIDNFEIISKIGDGPLGSVYLTKRFDQSNNVCLKVFNKNLTHDLEAQNQFIDQMADVADFPRAFFVRYSDVGIHRGRCFATMNYYTNGSLSSKIATRAPFTELDSLKIAQMVARALETVYNEYNFVHLNLKPSNILFNTHDEIFISDYGFSLWASKFLLDDMAIASSSYISPEQIKGDDPADWYCDLYSLGVILYQMLTGLLPFFSSDDNKLLKMHLSQQVPSTESINPNVKISPESFDLIKKMMEKNPKKRFKSWNSFLEQISEMVKQRQRKSQQIKPFKPPKGDSNATQSDKMWNHVTSSKIKRKKLNFQTRNVK